MTKINLCENDYLRELNCEQRKAAEHPIKYCTKIVAGAGTGKTKIISKRFVKLVKDMEAAGVENPVSKLLVITFTKKAAAEMKARIIKELKKNNIDYSGADFNISTFHGFCGKILRKYATAVGLASDFKIEEESKLREIYDNIIKRIRYGETDKIENVEQTARELCISPDIILSENIIKFNKATDISEGFFDEIYKTIKKIKSMGFDAKEFKEKALPLTAKYTDTVSKLTLDKSSKQETASEWQKLLSDYIKGDTPFLYDENEGISSKEKLRGAFTEIADKPFVIKSGSKNISNWSLPENFVENTRETGKLEEEAIKLIAFIYDLYDRELIRRNIADFDDVINKTVKILKQNPEIKAEYEKSFEHITVDEFQDSNGAQLSLILSLIGAEPNLTFVGDRKQSIYGFRFAVPENIDLLYDIVTADTDKQYEEITLKTNYRSIPAVLEVANSITSNELNLPSERLIANKDINIPEEQTVFVTPIQPRLTNQDEKHAAAEYTAGEILKIKDKYNAEYKDIAILVSGHADADIIEKVLTKAGIPSLKQRNIAFFNKPVVKNVESIIRLVANIKDEQAFVRILNCLLSKKEIFELKSLVSVKIEEKLGFDAMKKLNFPEKILYAFETNIFESSDFNHNVVNKLTSLRDFIVSSANEDKSPKSIQEAFSFSFPVYPKCTPSEELQYKFELNVFEKLIDKIVENKKNTPEFFLKRLEQIKLDAEFELPSSDFITGNAVRIMTVHASKGLEFKYVFLFLNITGKNKGDKKTILLDIKNDGNSGFGLILGKNGNNETPKSHIYNILSKKPEKLAEKMRLLYVAITRAEVYLNILTSDSGKNAVNATLPSEYYTNPVMPSELPQKTEVLSAADSREPQTIGIFPKDNHSVKEPPAISFSLVNTYLYCKTCCLLKYKYGFPSFVGENAGIVTGSAIHNLIYLSYMNSKIYTDKELNDFIPDCNADEEIRIRKLYRSFAELNLIGKTVVSEKHFETLIETGEKSVILTGDADILIPNGDGFDIADFKTNRNIEKSLDRYFLQLSFYEKALRSENIKICEQKIILLTEDSAQIYVPSGEQKQHAKADVERLIEEIHNLFVSKDAITPERQEQCETCGYKRLCFGTESKY